MKIRVAGSIVKPDSSNDVVHALLKELIKIIATKFPEGVSPLKDDFSIYSVEYADDIRKLYSSIASPADDDYRDGTDIYFSWILAGKVHAIYI